MTDPKVIAAMLYDYAHAVRYCAVLSDHEPDTIEAQAAAVDVKVDGMYPREMCERMAAPNVAELAAELADARRVIGYLNHRVAWWKAQARKHNAPSQPGAHSNIIGSDHPANCPVCIANAGSEPTTGVAPNGLSVPVMPGNWPEDASHENGDYECSCVKCKATFYGHKRRVICKVCATQSQDAEKEIGDE